MRRTLAVSLLCAALVGCDGGVREYETHPVVDATVTHFAPGVELGGGIERVTALTKPHRRFVPGIGVVARAQRAPFVQLRAYPDADVRERGEIDATAPLRAIELVSLDPRAREQVMSQITIAVGAAPAEGCLAARAGVPARTVHYWVAPDGGGGLAVASDWLAQPADSIDGNLWSLWAWSGPFRGGPTMLSVFAAAPCPPAVPDGRIGTSDAAATLDRAFRDSLHGCRRTSGSRTRDPARPRTTPPGSCGPPP